MQFPELNYPFEFHTAVLRGGISIAYTDESLGSNTIVFIHGLASCMSAWRRLIPLLKNNFRCISLDLPGYGKSSAGFHKGSMLFYAEVISEFIAKLRLAKVTLCGHSMGGQIAVATALNYPDIIEKLILLAPAGFEVFTEEESALLKNYFTPEYYHSSTAEQIRSNYEINFFEMPDSAEEMIADRIKMRDCANFEDYCRVVSNSLSGMLDYPVFGGLGEIIQPTSVLFGKNDRLIPNGVLHKDQTPEKVARAGASQIKNSAVKILENCGHFIQFEKPDETANAVSDFLRKQSSEFLK